MSDDPNGIGEYYERIRQQQAEAMKKWEEAKAAGADLMELRRLWEKMIDAGNTGD